jgi:hypothetical protein
VSGGMEVDLSRVDGATVKSQEAMNAYAQYAISQISSIEAEVQSLYGIINDTSKYTRQAESAFMDFSKTSIKCIDDVTGSITSLIHAVNTLNSSNINPVHIPVSDQNSIMTLSERIFSDMDDYSPAGYLKTRQNNPVGPKKNNSFAPIYLPANKDSQKKETRVEVQLTIHSPITINVNGSNGIDMDKLALQLKVIAKDNLREATDVLAKEIQKRLK